MRTGMTNRQTSGTIAIAMGIVLRCAIGIAAVNGQQLPGLLSGPGKGFDWKTGFFKGFVIDYSWNDGRRWLNPLDGQTYDVPDQLWVTNTPSLGAQSEQHKIVAVSEYMSIQERMHATSLSLGVIGLAQTKGKMLATSILSQSGTFLYWATRLVASHKFSLFPYNVNGDQTNSMFQKAVNALPQQCLSSHEQFLCTQFVEAFGTHVVYQMSFGAEVQMFIAAEESLYTKHTAFWVSQQFRMYLGIADFLIGIGRGFNMTGVTVDHDFLESVSIDYVWEGWNQTYSALSREELASLVSASPAATRPLLIPITELFTEKQPTAGMAAFIEQYLTS